MANLRRKLPHLLVQGPGEVLPQCVRVCVCIHTLAQERNFAKWLIYLPTNGILADCSSGNRLARLVLCNLLERVNNILPAQLAAPVKTRQFVDDLTTVLMANVSFML